MVVHYCFVDARSVNEERLEFEVVVYSTGGSLVISKSWLLALSRKQAHNCSPLALYYPLRNYMYVRWTIVPSVFSFHDFLLYRETLLIQYYCPYVTSATYLNCHVAGMGKAKRITARRKVERKEEKVVVPSKKQDDLETIISTAKSVRALPC